MKSVIRASAIAVLIVLSCPSTFAQTSNSATESSLVLEQGVAPHKGLDKVYRRFTEGYKKLDAASVAGLYSETARILRPEATFKSGGKKFRRFLPAFLIRSNSKTDD